MSEAFTLLGPAETIAAADRIFDQVDQALSLRRGLEKITDRELISIVVFLRQLHRIAEAAARYSARGSDIELWHDLQAQLLVPGYLPVPSDQEPSHGEG